MKKSKTTKLVPAIALLLILAIGLAMPTVNLGKAQTVQPSPISGQTWYPYIYVAPNPIGVGQAMNIGFGFIEPTSDQSYYTGWKVTVTDPSGKNQTLGPFTSDATGGTGTSFTPNAVGTWLFQVFYPGGDITYLAEGGQPSATYYVPPTYTKQVNLTVQQQQVGYPSVSALPTSYWQYPVYSDNEGWYNVSGNWLMSGYDTTRTYTGAINGVYDPYTTVPTTAHILWTQPWMIGGVASYNVFSKEGNTKGGSGVETYYTGASYREEVTPPVIIDGMLYYDQVDPPAYGFYCINLYNGQEVWYQNETFLSGPGGSVVGGTAAQISLGQTLIQNNENQNGAVPYLWDISGSTWARFSAYSGDLLNTITGAIGVGTEPSTASNIAVIYGPSGELLIYYFEQANPESYTGTLALWNSTLCGLTNTYSQTETLNIPWKNGIQWNVTVPACPEEGQATNGMLWDPNNPTELIITNQTLGNPSVIGPFEDIAYSTATGQELWSAIRNPNGEMGSWSRTLTGGRSMGDGIYTIYREETNQLYAFNATTGQQLWVSAPRPNALGAFCTGEVFGYGLIYVDGYDGYIYAYNETTGATVWSFYDGSANPSGLETPYGQYTLYGGNIVADGMIVAINQEHTEQSPLFVGEGMYVINATTGKLIWQIRGQIKQPSIAGGILVGPNMCDGQIYAFGRGPSKTTINAPDAGVTTNAPIMITGSVTDVSAGASQEAVAANFPNGLPCVSDASMTGFMEAVYEQQPMPTNVTGVPVTISVLDSNGNYRTIGTTTTNALGDYSLSWTPDIPGNFTVYATFAGTGGYYGSSASSAFCASSPTAPTPTPPPVSGFATQSSIMYVGAATIAVIIIIGAVLALIMLRKRA